MLKEKKILCLFQLFQPLDLQPVAFKTLERSISYNPSHIGPAKNKKENAISADLYTVQMQQLKSLITLIALL